MWQDHIDKINKQRSGEGAILRFIKHCFSFQQSRCQFIQGFDRPDHFISASIMGCRSIKGNLYNGF